MNLHKCRLSVKPVNLTSQPNWRRVLKWFYDNGLTIELSVDDANKWSIDEDNRILSDTGLREEEVIEIIELLEDEGKYDMLDPTYYEDLHGERTPVDVERHGDRVELRLNEKGMRIAHEQKLNSRQNHTNKYLVIFTFAMVVIELFRSVPSLPKTLAGSGLFVLVSMLLLRDEILTIVGKLSYKIDDLITDII